MWRALPAIVFVLGLALSHVFADGLSAPIAAPQIGQTGSALSYPPQSSVCSQATTLLGRMDGSENTSAVTNLICGMVSDGNWSSLDFFYIFAINSAVNAKLNWVSTSYPITVNGTCTFTANQGYTGDSSTCNLDTAYVPAAAVEATVNSASFAVCLLGTAGGDNGGVQGANGFYTVFGINSPGVWYYDVNDGNFPLFTYSTSTGQWVLSRTASNLITLYQNGSSVATNATTGTALPTTNHLLLLASNSSTSVAQHFSSEQEGAAFAGAGLTGAQVTSIYNRIHTYMGAVSAPSGC